MADAEKLRATVYAVLASGKNYAYIDAIHRSQLSLHKIEDLEAYMGEIARIEARAVVDMAVEIEKRMQDLSG